MLAFWPSSSQAWLKPLGSVVLLTRFSMASLLAETYSLQFSQQKEVSIRYRASLCRPRTHPDDVGSCKGGGNNHHLSIGVRGTKDAGFHWSNTFLSDAPYLVPGFRRKTR